jgi:nucleotide-binding universal stress UspA family protein
MASAPPPYASILIALDDSPRAPAVFSAGVALARLAGAQVFLVRVLTGPADIPAPAHTEPDDLDRDVAEIARAALRHAIDTVPDVAFVAPIVVPGDPWRRILETATQVDADLIVIGSHRVHGVERLLGTVAARVVNHADRSVLVVRERPAPTGGAVPSPRHQKM